MNSDTSRVHFRAWTKQREIMTTFTAPVVGELRFYEILAAVAAVLVVQESMLTRFNDLGPATLVAFKRPRSSDHFSFRHAALYNCERNDHFTSVITSYDDDTRVVGEFAGRTRFARENDYADVRGECIWDREITIPLRKVFDSGVARRYS